MLFLIVYLLTTLYIEMQAIKVPLDNAVVNICPDKIGSMEIMDGDKHTLAEAINYTCEYPEIEINLNQNRFINTVIVYGGGSITDDGVIYGSAGFSVTFGVNQKCGMFAKLPNLNISEMRVNCKSYLFPIQKVLIKLDHPLYVTEIELHKLGMTQPDVIPIIYRGCFQNLSETNVALETSDIKQCGFECDNRDILYMAFKNKTMCFCYSTLDEVNVVENARCSLNCDIPDYSCGGPDAYSVYIFIVRLPYLMGCSDANLTHDIILDKMNASYCIAHCDRYLFALVKNGIQCVCVSRIVITYVEGSACNISCPGDETSVCGGLDVWSVYKTCRFYTYDLPCSQLFRCDVWDKFGLCKTDCYEGYAGEYCAEIANLGDNFTISTPPNDEETGSNSLPTQTEDMLTDGDNLSTPGLSTGEVTESDFSPTETQDMPTEYTNIGENWSTPINSTDEDKDQKKDRFFLSQFFFIAIAMSIFGFAVFLILLWVSSKLAFG